MYKMRRGLVWLKCIVIVLFVGVIVFTFFSYNLFDNRKLYQLLSLKRKIFMAPLVGTSKKTNDKSGLLSELPPHFRNDAMGTNWISTSNRMLENESNLKNASTFKKKLKLALKKAQNQIFNILVWEGKFGDTDPFLIDHEKCGSCHVTFDKNKVNDPSTKSVVFHFTLSVHNMPSVRRRDQLYVWWCQETPSALRVSYRKKLKEFDEIFNLTMTNRRDSDVYFPYGTAAEILKYWKKVEKVDLEKDIDQLVVEKTHLVLWIVSNCGFTLGAVGRLKFVKKLMKAGLPVKQRGLCSGDNKPEMVNANVSRYYKFYLAFENSYHCRDYITEKVFRNALQFGSVPVVWGAKRSDYEATLPPGSFIFAEDFKTTGQLVDYLKFVGNNDKAYKEYFRWHSLEIEDMPMHDRATQWCQLCRILHGVNTDNVYNQNYNQLKHLVPMFGNAKSRVVKSLRDWFYGTEHQSCLYSY